MLTADIKRIIREQRLGFVGTVNADGTPNVSPKATFIVLDDATIAFGEIRSPGTVRNLRSNPAIEVNFVDPFARKGCRVGGIATVIERGAHGFETLLGKFGDYGDLASRLRAVVKIAVSRALPVTSPAHDSGSTEPELRRLWTARFRELQPNRKFEE